MLNINMVEVQLKQGTQEWLDWRGFGIGASAAATLLDCSPHETRHSFWMVKTKRKPPEDLSRNPNVIRGNRYESVVRGFMEQYLNTSIRVFCAEDKDQPHRKVSFDGVAFENVPVEIKCPSVSVFKDVLENGTESKAYKLYSIQVQYQIAMLNGTHGYLTFYCVDSKRMLPIRVERDEALITQIFKAVDEFWATNILRDVEPEKDPLRDAFTPSVAQQDAWSQAAMELFGIMEEESSLKAEMKKLQAERERISTNLMSQTKGFSSAECENIRITQIKRSGGVNWKAILKDNGIEIDDIDMNKYTGDASYHHRLTLRNKAKVKQQVDDAKVIKLHEMQKRVAQQLRSTGLL